LKGKYPGLWKDIDNLNIAKKDLESLNLVKNVKDLKIEYKWKNDLSPNDKYKTDNLYQPRSRMYVIGENQKLKKEIFGFCDTFTSEPLSAVFNASWSPCNE
jgi:hypothetical protein